MTDSSGFILPYILDYLSRRPDFCDTFDNLCREMQYRLLHERNCRYSNLPSLIQRALNVGRDLGIITLTDDAIRVPFNIRGKKKNWTREPNLVGANAKNAIKPNLGPQQITNKHEDPKVPPLVNEPVHAGTSALLVRPVARATAASPVTCVGPRHRPPPLPKRKTARSRRRKAAQPKRRRRVGRPRSGNNS